MCWRRKGFEFAWKNKIQWVGIFFKNSIFRLTADSIEASVTQEEERALTERIREDIRRIEAQRIALLAQQEQDLAELARIAAAAAQGEDPPPLPPKPEEQSNQVRNPPNPPIFSCLLALPELIQGLSAFSHLLWIVY